MLPGELIDDALATDPTHDRAQLRVSSKPTTPRANRPTSLGSTYTAESPADTLVSRRSNATTGSAKAMYSMVLFIVDTLLSGFMGSGHSPRSAVDSTLVTKLSGTLPGSSTWSCSPSRSRSATSSG